MIHGLDDKSRKDLVAYRMQRAKESLADADLLASSGSFNAAVNRLYYACYYACVALLVQNRIPANTHDGVKHQLGLHFVKAGRLDAKHGRFYSQLFSARQTGDYDDFVTFSQTDFEKIRPQAEEFIDAVLGLVIQ